MPPTARKTTTARRQPQDRQPKHDGSRREIPDAHFEWTDPSGKEWVSDKPIRDVVTPGLVRRNRANDMTFIMESMERLFADQPEFLDVIDADWYTMNACGEAFMDQVQDMGASMGESGGSST